MSLARMASPYRQRPFLRLLGTLGWLVSAHLVQAQVLEPVPPSDGQDLGRTGTASWQLQTIAIPEAPRRILGTGALTSLQGVIVETISGAWYSLADCEVGVCAELITAPHAPEVLPQGAVPGSKVATGRHRIARAWLAEPVQRLANRTLGGDVAGALVVEEQTARSYRIDLGVSEAFEDRRVRIVDLNTDDTDIILVVKSSQDMGASLAAIALGGEGLLQTLAESEPVGQPGGWLNPVGVGNFTGSGSNDVAIVRSPDADGELQILGFSEHAFSPRFRVRNISNHVPGSDIVDMAVVADFDGDGATDIAVPDASRQHIRILSFRNGQIAEPATIELPAPVTTEIAGIAAAPGQRPLLLMGLANGQLILLH
jgi:hypothetical protein